MSVFGNRSTALDIHSPDSSASPAEVSGVHPLEAKFRVWIPCVGLLHLLPKRTNDFRHELVAGGVCTGVEPVRDLLDLLGERHSMLIYTAGRLVPPARRLLCLRARTEQPHDLTRLFQTDGSNPDIVGHGRADLRLSQPWFREPDGHAGTVRPP